MVYRLVKWKDKGEIIIPELFEIIGRPAIIMTAEEKKVIPKDTILCDFCNKDLGEEDEAWAMIDIYKRNIWVSYALCSACAENMKKSTKEISKEEFLDRYHKIKTQMI